MELCNLLPGEVYQHLPPMLSTVNELRLRINRPVIAICNGRSITFNKVIVTKKHLDDIIYCACQRSVYIYADDIANCFITTENGMRIGIAGKCAVDNRKVTSFTDVTSLVIRIARQVIGCADSIEQYIAKPLASTLIISPPSAGKTTMLREVARKLSSTVNCLVADERGELSSCYGLQNALPMCDVLKAPKIFAMTSGIRSLAPQAVFCDELQEEEINRLHNVTYSGVKLYATLHAEDLSTAIKRHAAIKQYFQRYVVLSATPKVGTIKGVYDQALRLLS